MPRDLSGTFNPGRMRHLVTLESADETRAADRSLVKAWKDSAADIRAAIDTSGGREYLAAKAVTAELTHLVTIRWRLGVSPKMRVKFADPIESATKIFDIRAVVNADQKPRFLLLHCVELVGRDAQS